MAQNWNQFTVFWMNTATAPGTPLTGLSATINIRDLTGVLVANAQAMTELGWGWYIYTFAGYDNQKDYVYDCNPVATAYRESGVTDRRIDNLDKNLSQINGGWMRGSSSDFDANDRKLIKETHTKVMTLENPDFNEIKSHIDIAKTDVIDTIDSIEKKEVDTSGIMKGIGAIKAQNTKLASYLKWEDDKEKAEMEKNHKMMMDDMEKAYAEMEKANWKEKDDIMSSADEIIAVLEDENKSIWEETLTKIKTLLK